MIKLLLLVVAVLATMAFGDVQQTVNDVTSTKEGATWCPVPLVGTE
jgi:hypothetical protein